MIKSSNLRKVNIFTIVTSLHREEAVERSERFRSQMRNIEVEVGEDDIAKLECGYADTALRETAEYEWLNDCGVEWMLNPRRSADRRTGLISFDIAILNPTDAMLFKLTFGGA